MVISMCLINVKINKASLTCKKYLCLEKLSNISMKWAPRLVYGSHARLDHRSTKQLFNYPSTLCV